MGCIGGVYLSKFIDPESAEALEGFQFKGTGAMVVKLPNHVPTSHDGWLDTQIESLAQKGSLAPWSTVTETKVQPRSRNCLLLGVERNKPRLTWDAGTPYCGA